MQERTAVSAGSTEEQAWGFGSCRMGSAHAALSFPVSGLLTAYVCDFLPVLSWDKQMNLVRSPRAVWPNVLPLPSHAAALSQCLGGGEGDTAQEPLPVAIGCSSFLSATVIKCSDQRQSGE